MNPEETLARINLERHALELQEQLNQAIAQNNELKHEIRAHMNARRLLSFRIDNALNYICCASAPKAAVLQSVKQELTQAQEGR